MTSSESADALRTEGSEGSIEVKDIAKIAQTAGVSTAGSSGVK